jgi:hypothetical protein
VLIIIIVNVNNNIIGNNDIPAERTPRWTPTPVA